MPRIRCSLPRVTAGRSAATPADVDDEEVPSSIDLRTPEDAHEWVAAADRKRPWRSDLRAAIVQLVRGSGRVLELGPGPGLLAQAVLDACDVERYTLFDFSPPMLDLCRARLAGRAAACFVLGDFMQPGWAAALEPPFDAVVAMQAAHEIRHQRRLPRLYAEIWPLLRPGGRLVVCDHEPMDDSDRMRKLHATRAEQHAALAAARFTEVTIHAVIEGMYLCSGTRP